MTNSMIPNSFIPGTKAKASEVNENFIALANAIEQNRNLATSDIEDLTENIETMQETINSQKADKSELNIEHKVTTTGTNLNNYKTVGTYIFETAYKPTNIPKGSSGILIVKGETTSSILQIWICSDANPDLYTRTCTGGTWATWKSIQGLPKKANPGYLKLPNGIIIQWGMNAKSTVTYPVAFTAVACPAMTKNGYNGGYERSDTGTTANSLTGFSVGSAALFNSMNWVAIGY